MYDFGLCIYLLLIMKIWKLILYLTTYFLLVVKLLYNLLSPSVLRKNLIISDSIQDAKLIFFVKIRMTYAHPGFHCFVCLSVRNNSSFYMSIYGCWSPCIQEDRCKIIRDKTMAYKLMNISNDDRQIYHFCSWQLVV